MFFLLRTAFWISVVLVLLPTGQSAQAPEASKVGALDALSAATSAVSDMSQFCTRNPEACETGAQAAVVFGQRAQAGAKMVYDFLTERTETGSVATPADRKSEKAAAKSEKGVVTVKSQNTLKPQDLAPGHRGAQPR